MKKIYYWCPFIGNVATVKAVINSAYSLSKFSKNEFEPTIINSCGEWDNFQSILKQKKIKTKKFKNRFKIKINVNGFLKSRITYIKVFFSSFFLLRNTLKNDEPEYLIAHLITSLPLFLYLLFNFKTKLIIRISGKVKMNLFRKLFWNMCKKNISLITCPTKETQREFINLNLVKYDKIIYLPDPIIEIDEIIKDKKKSLNDMDFNKNFFVMIGRYTRQKNHILAIKGFKRLIHRLNNIDLVIIGSGELRKEYLNEINELNLNKRVKLIDYQKNIIPYLSKASLLISPSLWEDPGFVMIEAAACNTFVISSNCQSGPKEFLQKKNGLLFENNNINDFENKLIEYLNMSEKEIKITKIGAKKKSAQFTKFRHYKIIKSYLN